jgi:hypothetical protein
VCLNARQVSLTQPPLGAQSQVLDLFQAIAQHSRAHHIHRQRVRAADEDVHRHQVLVQQRRDGKVAVGGGGQSLNDAKVGPGEVVERGQPPVQCLVIVLLHPVSVHGERLLVLYPQRHRCHRVGL